MSRRLPYSEIWDAGDEIVETTSAISQETSKTTGEPIRNKFTPEDLELDKQGQIFANYYESEAFAGNLIFGFDNYLMNILPEQIRSREITINNPSTRLPIAKIIFNMERVHPPQRTPQDCRLNNLTYAGVIEANYQIFPMIPSVSQPNVYIMSEEPHPTTITPVKFEVGRIPIMVGSRYYDTAGRTEKERIERGECPKDPGCYFIIRGGQKVVNNNEHLRLNNFFTVLGLQDDKSRATTQMVTSNVYGTDLIVLYEGEFKTIEAHMPPFGKNDRRKPVKLNVYQIFRMMANFAEMTHTYNPDDESAIQFKDMTKVTELIMMFIPDPWKKIVYSHLIINQQIAESIGNDILVLENEHKEKSSYTIGPDILKKIDESFFSHMSAPRHRRLPLFNRLQMLAMMVARTVEVVAKLRAPDDRDDWGAKRVDTAAKAIEFLVSKLWKDRTNKLKDKFDKNNITIDSIATKIKDPSFTITEDIISSFTGQHWGAIGNNRKQVSENIVETLKTEQSVLASYSSALRFVSNINKRTHMENVRVAKGSQYGYVCAIETPEGSACGLVKHMTTMCSPSIDQNGEQVEDLILRCLAGDITALPENGRNAALVHNGRFLGWVKGPETRKKLVQMRRENKLARDSAFVLKLEGPSNASIMRRHIMVANGRTPATASNSVYGMGLGNELYTLRIYTDGARLTRPLLTVNNETGNLTIEDKGMWSAKWRELIESGCVEYIDAAEQHYIAVETSKDAFEQKRGEILEVERRLAVLNYDIVSLNSIDDPEETEYVTAQLVSTNKSVRQLKALLDKLKADFIYTHCEIDPSALLGTSASTIPWPTTNQGPRNTYQCLPDYEEILMADGSYKKLRDIQDGDSVLTINPNANIEGKKYDEIPSQIYNKKLSNPKESGLRMMKITTRDNRVIKATNNHPFLTNLGFVTAEELDCNKHGLAIRFNKNELVKSTPMWEWYTETGSYNTIIMPISSIEFIEEECLVGYFTTMSTNHTFVTKSGFITHNCGMAKQSIGIFRMNHEMMMDTQAKIMAYPTMPTFQPQLLKLLGLNELPSGAMVTLAIMAFDGDNQEDAVILDQDAVDRGLFMMKKETTLKYTIELETGKDTVIKNPLKAGFKRISDADEDYAGLDDDGLPKLNYPMKPGMYILGLIKGGSENISEKLGKREYGVVDQIFIGSDEEKKTIVKIKLRDVRSAIEGWKFAPRMAQKGTSSIVRPNNEMPKIMYGKNRGVTPSIIMNFHAMPSRMTISLLFEILASTVGGISGEHKDASAFRNVEGNVNEFERFIYDYGYQNEGYQLMMDSRTGLPFSSQQENQSELRAKIYTGPCFYQLLRHQVEDKEQARSTGAYDQDTQQPVKGRGNIGGLRFGEMEQWAGISHGASDFTRDSLCYRSDRFIAVYCQKCGVIPRFERVAGVGFRCLACGVEGPSEVIFGRSEISYGFIKMNRLMETMGLQARHTRFKEVEQ